MHNFNEKVAIIIPIRMASTRLPGKFHADIEGKPMILHIIDRARETNLTNIFVACDHLDHFKLVEDYGAHAIMTDEAHQSGSDRVFEALELIDPEKQFEYVINLQGDIPFVDPKLIRSVILELYQDEKADISTMLAAFENLEDIKNPNFVKAIFNINHHAIYFSRLPIPLTMGTYNPEYYHHIGIYGYRRASLEKFISLPQSGLELAEKLEQLRAIENGMIIKVGITNEIPVSVDVPEDLGSARVFAKEFFKSS
ncbi:MAG: 3-deoxy-manno-octulosonate cytidylyltransferase [Pseudomonadota bacterium]